MSPVRRLLLALVGSAVALAASACSESSAPTKEQYTAMADDVCQEVDEELDEMYEDYMKDVQRALATGESTIYTDRPEHWVRSKVVPKYESLSNRLKGIPPPEDDHAYLGDLYQDLDQRIELFHRSPSDGREVVDDDTQLRDRFSSYGMDECPMPLTEDEDAEADAEGAEADAEGAEAGQDGAEAGQEGEGQ